MHLGFDLQIRAETGLAIPIDLPIQTHPHALITGASGSGKSYALLYLLGNICSSGKVEIYFCDFKNSDDFRFLKDYKHYYAGDNCLAGLLEYGEIFQTARESGRAGKRHLMIFDEYPAFIGRLSMLDKTKKTKNADAARQVVADILMLGRGLAYGIWIVTQRPDASLFNSGAGAGVGSRENFMCVVALGRLSKEQKTMVFPGLADEINELNFIPKVGEGLILADGKPLKAVKFPRFRDIEGWKANICSAIGIEYRAGV